MHTFTLRSQQNKILRHMKSLFISFILLVLLAFSGMSQSDYYYYNGEQIQLDPFNRAKYIIIDDTVNSLECLIDVLNCPEVQIVSFYRTNVLELLNVYDSTATEKFYAVLYSLENIDEDYLINIPEILYVGRFFHRGHDLYGESAIFHVKVENELEINNLDSLANLHDLTILGNSLLAPNWYTLECFNYSTGDALEMANLFFETGLFIYSEPDWIHMNNSSILDKKTLDISVYPNPTSDILNIESEDSYQFTDIVLYDTNLKKIKSYKCNTKQISMRDVSPGLYFLEIRTNNKSTIIKIISH